MTIKVFWFWWVPSGAFNVIFHAVLIIACQLVKGRFTHGWVGISTVFPKSAFSIPQHIVAFPGMTDLVGFLIIVISFRVLSMWGGFLLSIRCLVCGRGRGGSGRGGRGGGGGMGGGGGRERTRGRERTWGRGGGVRRRWGVSE